jgi:deazaflavin-dependent oxidoreductase (nitroreductase family)
MGFDNELGYRHQSQTRFQRGIVAIASTRPLSTINRRLLPTLDRLVLAITGGRSTLTSLASGLPVLWLTSVGARSGLARTSPLLGFPLGEDMAVIGTSFGQKTTPGWVHNLEAHPDASAVYRGSEVRVVARRAESEETKLVWETAASAYPGYASYARWASHRQIRVFVLETAEDPGHE